MVQLEFNLKGVHDWKEKPELRTEDKPPHLADPIILRVYECAKCKSGAISRTVKTGEWETRDPHLPRTKCKG